MSSDSWLCSQAKFFSLQKLRDVFYLLALQAASKLKNITLGLFLPDIGITCMCNVEKCFTLAYCPQLWLWKILPIAFELLREMYC